MRRSSSASTRQTRARETTTLSGATFSVTPVDAEAEPLITEATSTCRTRPCGRYRLHNRRDEGAGWVQARRGSRYRPHRRRWHGCSEQRGPSSYTLDTAEYGAFVLTCSDEPYVLQLLKTDPDGSVLPDASFDVTGQFAGGGNERERPDGCTGDGTTCLAAHSGADVHARRDRRAGGLSAACRLRAVRASGQPAQRRRLGAHMVP